MALNSKFFNALPKAQAIGIDVSKAKLDICCLTNDGHVEIQVANQPEAVKVFSEKLVKQGYSQKIIMESTGHYTGWPRWNWPSAIRMCVY